MKKDWEETQRKNLLVLKADKGRKLTDQEKKEVAQIKKERADLAIVAAMGMTEPLKGVGKIVKPAVETGTDALATEARKYKTAEEITENIKSLILEQGELASQGKWDELSNLEKQINKLKKLRNNFKETKIDYSEIPLYHGTQSDVFTKFDLKQSSSNTQTSTRGIYFFTKKEPAINEYGKNIIEAKAKIKNPLIVDGDRDWNSLDFQREIEKAEKGLMTDLDDYIISGSPKKYDAIIIKNANSGYGYGYGNGFDEVIIPANKIKNITIIPAHTDIWNKANKKPPAKGGLPELGKTDDLFQEARKYKSAEEFVKAQFSKPPKYGMSHRPSWDGMPPAHNLLEGKALPRDVYTHPDLSIANGAIRRGEKAANESWQALQKIKGKPNAKIIVYRAGAKNELNIGDWITLSKEYAKQSIEGTEKVHSFKVIAKDVIFAGDDINEFGYYPKSQLIDIWNKENKKKRINLAPRNK